MWLPWLYYNYYALHIWEHVVSTTQAIPTYRVDYRGSRLVYSHRLKIVMNSSGYHAKFKIVCIQYMYNDTTINNIL